MIMTECSGCEAVVSVEALAQYSAVLDPRLGAVERVTFARCPECSSPLLVGEELYGTDQGRKVWSNPYRLYPPRDDLLRLGIPRVVRDHYKEAVSCFTARAYCAATIMCRKALEASCIERHITQPTLLLSLAEMRNQGIIETRMFEWAEILPHLADEPDAMIGLDVSREEALDVLAFTDAFISYLYIFRKGLHEFRRRRANGAVERAPLVSEPTALAAAAASASRPSNGDEPT